MRLVPIYSYKGLNPSGKELKASIGAESIAQAKEKLRSTGIILESISEKKIHHKEGNSGQSFSFLNRVKVEDLAMMTRQFSTLLKAKIQVVQALNALQDQVDDETLRTVLADIKQMVNEGSSLSKALQKYPKIFDSVYVNMVDAGESSGTLDVVLVRLADFSEARVRLKNKIKGAMLYPIIMMAVGGGLISVLFTVVIPKITKIFINSKKTIPLQTEIAIWISEFLQNYWWACILGGITAYWLLRKWSQTKKGTYRWHRWQLQLPFVGPLIVMINVGRFCSTLSTLLNASVPILVCMQIVKNLIPNVILKNAIEEAKAAIAEGKSMAPPLKASQFFPSMVTHMISLGEKSGELLPMLKIIAENYEDQVKTRLEGLTSVLNPIMIVILGGMVGFVLFAVIVPMLELNRIN